MRRALSKLVRFVRWIAAPEELAPSDPERQPGGAAGPVRGAHVGFVRRLTAAEHLPGESPTTDALATATESGCEPPGPTVPSRSIVRFLFAADEMPADAPGSSRAESPEPDAARGMSLRRLFARERLDDVESNREGGTPAR